MADDNQRRAEQFAKRLRDRADRMVRRATTIQRKAALLCDRIVVMGTPVDTGRARSNTIVSTPARVFSTRLPYAPYAEGTSPGVGESANTEGALSQAREAVARHQPHDPIIIQNNVEYFGVLNDGHSAQAPAGFVDSAIAGTRRFIQAQKWVDGSDR